MQCDIYELSLMLGNLSTITLCDTFAYCCEVYQGWSFQLIPALVLAKDSFF